MNYDEYKNLERFEEQYWWHKGRKYLLMNLIKKYLDQNSPLRIFEIGCGVGGTLLELKNSCEIVGIDKSKEAVEICNSKSIPNIILGDFVTYNLDKYRSYFDCILALDTLEHIQDDCLVMKKAMQLLKPEGKLIITAPAHKFLWSEHDEALHHKRRYHSVELKQKILDAGYRIDKLSYFVFFAFLPILIYRLWNNFFRRSAYPESSYVELPRILNDFGYKILQVETKLLIKTKLPIGTTFVVVASKYN